MKAFKITFLAFIICLIFLGTTSFWKKSEPVTKITLGKMLFNDPILSLDSSISCASCHIPKFAFADTAKFSKGVFGGLTKRNTPSAMNMDLREIFFWDGRAATLEHQAKMPIEDIHEMGLNYNTAVARICKSVKYVKWFKKVYNQLPDSATILNAIAEFERSLETSNTPNDRYLSDITPGLSKQQLRGRELFTSSRLNCFECHFSPDLTGDEFKNIGLFNGKTLNDSGRFGISKNPLDIGKFKVPGLRNVAITAPYMHNGMFKTLTDVINHYNQPDLTATFPIGRDTVLRKNLFLTPQEKLDLKAFLESLTDDKFAYLLKLKS